MKKHEPDVDRMLMVFDGTAWFARRIASIRHDLDKNEKVYTCDKHLGGPFDRDEAISFIMEHST